MRRRRPHSLPSKDPQPCPRPLGGSELLATRLYKRAFIPIGGNIPGGVNEVGDGRRRAPRPAPCSPEPFPGISCPSLPLPRLVVCGFPGAAGTKRHKLGLNTRDVFPQLWRPEAEMKVSQGPAPPGGTRGVLPASSCPLWPCCSARLGLSMHTANHASSARGSALSVFVCLSSSHKVASHWI